MNGSGGRKNCVKSGRFTRRSCTERYSALGSDRLAGSRAWRRWTGSTQEDSSAGALSISLRPVGFAQITDRRCRGGSVVALSTGPASSRQGRTSGFPLRSWMICRYGFKASIASPCHCDGHASSSDTRCNISLQFLCFSSGSDRPTRRPVPGAEGRFGPGTSTAIEQSTRASGRAWGAPYRPLRVTSQPIRERHLRERAALPADDRRPVLSTLRSSDRCAEVVVTDFPVRHNLPVSRGRRRTEAVQTAPERASCYLAETTARTQRDRRRVVFSSGGSPPALVGRARLGGGPIRCRRQVK